MTWLDAAIGWLSPKAGLKRARARAALGVIRAYEGANTTRRTVHWKTSGLSANGEIASALSRLRNRSRDLVRNNPYGRRAIGALVGNAVGTGISLGCGDTRLRKAWAAWVSEADFYGDQDLYGLQALIARACFESGDCLVVRVRTETAKAGRSGVPLKIKVLEGDFLDTTKMGQAANGNFVLGGIEIDREGRRVAYHIHRVHPGETVIVDPKAQSDRVPAEDVIYHFEKDRPGQLLGVPRLAASIMKLRDLDEYQEALLVKKKIEACFAMFVSSDDDSMRVGTSSETETDADGNSRRVEKLSPGAIIYGKTGEQVTFGEPSAGGDDGFTDTQLHAIAAGAGVTYTQLTGDLSRANYSSMRGGRAEFKILVEQYRWLSLMPQVNERIFAWFEEAAFQAAKIRKIGYEHVWTPPRWEYVNPREDVQADKEELGAGLASLSEKLRARGEDPEAVFAEIAAERKQLAELGIVVDYSAPKAKPAAADDDGAGKGDGDDDGGGGGEGGDGADGADGGEGKGKDGKGDDRAGRAVVVNVAPPSVSVAAPVVNIAPPAMTVGVPEAIRHEVTQCVEVQAPDVALLAEEVRSSSREAAVQAAQLGRQIDRLARIAAADRVPVFDDAGNPVRSRIDLTEQE